MPLSPTFPTNAEMFDDDDNPRDHLDIDGDGMTHINWMASVGSVLTSYVTRWIKYPVYFNDPDLLTGVSIYTPAVGDIIDRVWVSVAEVFDGTTPILDLGTFDGTDVGMFDTLGNAVDLTVADSAAADPNLLVSAGALAGNFLIIVPQRFTATVPLKVVVSQNGHANGADPGATQGRADVYLSILQAANIA